MFAAVGVFSISTGSLPADPPAAQSLFRPWLKGSLELRRVPGRREPQAPTRPPGILNRQVLILLEQPEQPADRVAGSMPWVFLPDQHSQRESSSVIRPSSRAVISATNSPVLDRALEDRP
jgi:hypothetical protein